MADDEDDDDGGGDTGSSAAFSSLDDRKFCTPTAWNKAQRMENKPF